MFQFCFKIFKQFFFIKKPDFSPADCSLNFFKINIFKIIPGNILSCLQKIDYKLVCQLLHFAFRFFSKSPFKLCQFFF